MFGMGGGELVHHVYSVNAFGRIKYQIARTMESYGAINVLRMTLKVKFKKRCRGEWI
jgi:hypothetical protein